MQKLSKNKNALSIEMILAPIGVSRVTKNKFLKSVVIMDIYPSHSFVHGVLTIQEASEEDSKFLPKIAQTVTVYLLKSMIFCWIKFMNNFNCPLGLQIILQFILHIIITSNSIIKNGIKETDIFTIIFMLHISHKIKLKMPMVGFGQLILLKSD